MIRIFVEYDDDVYRLMCDDGRMKPMPAGQRLFRAPPYPLMNFTHDTMERAEEDAQKLRNYLDGLTKKKPSKKQSREFVA